MLVAHAERIPAAAPTGHLPTIVWARVTGAAFGAMEWVTQAFCGLTGHDLAFHFEPNKVSLHCLNCGHTTPGWTTSALRVRPR